LRVLRSFLDQSQAHQVGGRGIEEYWIPAEDLPALSAAIVGTSRLRSRPASPDQAASRPYRAWLRNTASIALACRCGFAYYCDGLLIDLLP